MTGRAFTRVWAGCMVLVVITVMAQAAVVRAADDRPNILVIMSDEHNVDVTGCYGNRIVQTPNLDRLAAGGVTFEAAYTNSPLCAPCRLSFTSGKYISRSGAWSNDSWLPSDDYPSIARIMTAAGYDAILDGKMHYDPSRLYGFTRICAEPHSTFKRGKYRRRDPDDLTSHGSNPRKRFDMFYPSERSPVLKHDQKVTEQAIEFFKNRKPTDKPFFMLAGYLAPHFPLIVPEKYWDMYKGKVPMPEIPANLPDGLPLNYRHLRVGFDMRDVPAETVKKGRELYYGLTTWLDVQIGMTLKALEESGLADNTVVIYTSDHGENLGEHAMWWKNCMYEHGARVPLIVHWPKRWRGGQRRAGACSLVDVVQTVAELGGAKVPADWDGDSLTGYLDDPQAAWKDFALSEYYAHLVASGFVMFRRGQYKYVYHIAPDEKHPAERELYDLKADPKEFKNLAGDPAYQKLVAELHAAMVKELGENPEVTEQRCRAEIAKGYGRKPATKAKPAPKKKAK